jgi:hypothetical protein
MVSLAHGFYTTEPDSLDAACGAEPDFHNFSPMLVLVDGTA